MSANVSGRSLAEWKRMVRGTTCCLTSEQIDEVAHRLAAAPPGTTCVWHEAAAVTGTKCWCAACACVRRFA